MNSPSGMRAPDALLIVLGVLLCAVILTWFVPSGEFQRAKVGSRTVVVAGTYEAVAANPVAWHGFLTAPVKGLTDKDAALIIAFVLIVGGSFAMINATGAIAAGINWLVHCAGDNPARRRLVIPVLMVAFSLGGNTFGMAEEVLVFVLITLALSRRMGWDPIVGVAIPFIGSGVGFAGAAFNPFTVGIAQGLSELPIFSGWQFRMVMWAVLTGISIIFVMRYAAMLEKDPTRSLSPFANDKAIDANELELEKITPNRIAILVLLLAGIVMLIVGVTRWDWYIEEIAALFLSLGFVAAVLGRIRPNDAAQAFGLGAREMVATALIIGLSRSVLLVMQEGKVIDTMLHSMSQAASGLPPVISVQVMLAVQFCLNFFVPSGSGQAALTMPIMAPLADLLHMPRQAAVLAYQLGDGLCNFIIPTSGITMGLLAIARISFVTWLRWIAWLMVWLIGAGMVFLALGATVINW